MYVNSKEAVKKAKSQIISEVKSKAAMIKCTPPEDKRMNFPIKGSIFATYNPTLVVETPFRQFKSYAGSVEDTYGNLDDKLGSPSLCLFDNKLAATIGIKLFEDSLADRPEFLQNKQPRRSIRNLIPTGEISSFEPTVVRSSKSKNNSQKKRASTGEREVSTDNSNILDITEDSIIISKNILAYSDYFEKVIIEKSAISQYITQGQ